jgi:hypothetical protein
MWSGKSLPTFRKNLAESIFRLEEAADSSESLVMIYQTIVTAEMSTITV